MHALWACHELPALINLAAFHDKGGLWQLGMVDALHMSFCESWCIHMTISVVAKMCLRATGRLSISG